MRYRSSYATTRYSLSTSWAGGTCGLEVALVRAEMVSTVLFWITILSPRTRYTICGGSSRARWTLPKTLPYRLGETKRYHGWR